MLYIYVYIYIYIYICTFHPPESAWPPLVVFLAPLHPRVNRQRGTEFLRCRATRARSKQART